MKKLIKTLLGKVLPLRLIIDNKDIPIFMFHRVVEETGPNQLDRSLYLHKTEFQSILKLILQHFQIVCLKNYIEKWEIPSKNPICFITFDDGWLDNYQIALPVLRKLSVPATIFIPTSFIGKNKIFWFERLSNCIVAIESEDSPKKIKTLSHLLNLRENDLCLKSKKKLYTKAVEILKLKPQPQIDKIIQQLELELGAETNENLDRTVLNWEEIREMGKLNISFGSHGVNHSIIPLLSKIDKKHEINHSREVLMNQQINYVDCFSFPNGSYDQESLDLADDAGYSLLLSASINPCGQGKSSKLAHRINISRDFQNISTFSNTLTKAKVYRKMYRHNK